MSATHGFKFIAADGKKRLSDTLDSEGVIKLAKNFPNTKSMKFLDWFYITIILLTDKVRKTTLYEQLGVREGAAV